MTDSDILKGTKAISEHIGFSRDETQRKAFDGEIPAFKLGGIWHMRKSDWQGFVDDLAAQTTSRAMAFVQSQRRECFTINSAEKLKDADAS